MSKEDPTVDHIRTLRSELGIGLIMLRRAVEVRRDHECTILEAIGYLDGAGLAYAVKGETQEERQRIREAKDWAYGRKSAEQWRENPVLARIEEEIDGPRPRNSIDSSM